MDKYFRTEQGKIIEVIDYSIQQVVKNPDVKIYIGCDSQVHGPKIVFVLTVAYQAGRNGVHCIYKRIEKERPPKYVHINEQVKLRLREEIYMTMEIVQYVLDNSSIKIAGVEFDFNDVKDTLSKPMIAESVGWARGLGLKALTKPDEMYATKFSNYKC